MRNGDDSGLQRAHFVRRRVAGFVEFAPGQLCRHSWGELPARRRTAERER